MAQAPQPPHKPAPPQQHQQTQHKPPDKPADKDRDKPTDKDREQTARDDKLHEQGEYKQGHVPLRDPTEGKPPAVAGGHVVPQGEERDRGPGGYRPTIGVKGEPIEDGERDPDTIAEEQRRRSDEMAAMGVQAWKEAHDERSDEEKRQNPLSRGMLPPEAHPDNEPRRVEHHKAP